MKRLPQILTLIFTTSLTTLIAAGNVQPNLIVFLCDNLGYGDIEPFGSSVHRTPSLNRMAREGRRFTHFYATAGVCTPSRASLMTGCYAQRVGMHANPRDGHVLRPISPYGLHPDEITIAEILKSHGYATTIIGKWHLGDQLEFCPTQQGFDSYFGIPYSDDMVGGKALGKTGKTWPPLPLMENETVIEAPVDRNYLTKRYTERALQFVTENRERPFFLYLPQAMPGSEIVPFASPAFRGNSKNGLWGDSVEELDWSTGQLLDKLVELGIDDKTLVIWTSDNGARLTADPTSLARGSNRPLHGRGYTTAEGRFPSTHDRLVARKNSRRYDLLRDGDNDGSIAHFGSSRRRPRTTGSHHRRPRYSTPAVRRRKRRHAVRCVLLFLHAATASRAQRAMETLPARGN